MSRQWSGTRVCLLALVIAGMFGAHPAAGPARGEGEHHEVMLEASLLVLNEDDFLEAGLDGMAMLEFNKSVNSLDLGVLVRGLGSFARADALRETLDSAGFALGYESRFIRRENPDDEGSEVEFAVDLAVFVFADEQGASDAWALHEEGYDNGNLVEQMGREEGIGEDLLIVRRARENLSDGAPLDLSGTFHDGTVIVHISMRSHDGQEPDTDALAALAEQMEVRIDEVRGSGTPGLGNQVIRLTDGIYGSLFEIRRDAYVRIDGKDTEFATDGPMSFDARVEGLGDATESYVLHQHLQGVTLTEPALPSQFGWMSRVLRFENDAAAEVWMSGFATNLDAGDDGITEYAARNVDWHDVAAPGDEHLAATYDWDQPAGGTSWVTRVMVRSGNIVGEIRIQAWEGDWLDAAVNMASIQAGCLEPGGCPQPIVVNVAVTGQSVLDEAATGRPLDLAAIIATPAEAGEFGFSFAYAEMLYPDEFVGVLEVEKAMSRQEARAAIEEYGFIRMYRVVYLYTCLDGATWEPADLLLTSYTMEFADDVGAVNAWYDFEDESDDPESRDELAEGILLDQAEITFGQGEDIATGEPFFSVDLTVRRNNLHYGIGIVHLANEELNGFVPNILVQAMADRVEHGVYLDHVDLSNMTVRLAGDDVVSYWDHYLARDGGEVTVPSTIPGEFGTVDGYLDGVTDAYVVRQRVGDNEHPMWLEVTMFRFADEKSASEWLAMTGEFIDENREMGPFRIETEAEVVGNESIAYTVSRDDPDTFYAGVRLRVGEIVAVVELSGPDPLSASSVAEIAGAAATCLEEGACLEPLEIPQDLASQGPGWMRDRPHHQLPANPFVFAQMQDGSISRHLVFSRNAL